MGEPAVSERMDRLSSDLADGTWAARHGDLAGLDAVDGGFRLLVRSATGP